MTVIGILECGQTDPDWIEEHGEMADPFPRFLGQVSKALTYKIYKAHIHQLPKQADECDAWLITGSPLSVYERPAWLTELSDFLVEAVKTSPVVGICFGHQLLHDALGGKVEHTNQWGIGVQEYHLKIQPGWAPTEEQLSAFHLIAFHQDQVTQAAPNTNVLAGNDFCPLGITTIGDNVFTIQAHPEMTTKLASDLYESQRELHGAEKTNRAVQSLQGRIDGKLAAEWVLAFIQDRFNHLTSSK
ncbi:glutamine amidotransferase-related protein [Vibrio sp. MEBiC08052]|uniref:glutamine amidotransferase-related protein n=1 Tax=Vibrio sp. MEBiC08052 TaxID=1761910 RepID=UPI0007406EDE|nr:hypothetical protein [Vibrio sp. MEBiC08052]KUI98601.1 hypothetical protein VRK_24690 [Vibrio sp. MEBiC08052]